jgi:hypothetical protein
MSKLNSNRERDSNWRKERDSNPRMVLPITRFPSVRLQPLGHLSINKLFTSSTSSQPFKLTAQRALPFAFSRGHLSINKLFTSSTSSQPFKLTAQRALPFARAANFDKLRVTKLE